MKHASATALDRLEALLYGDLFERFEVTTLAQQEAFIERLVAAFDSH